MAKKSILNTEEYEGWSNWFTWNVSLWLFEDEHVYTDMVKYVTQQRKLGQKVTYEGILEYADIPKGTRTPDGASMWSPNVNRQELLDCILREI